ncbi:MAG: hypothetical protein KDE53_02580 [Caldilineaceae bacterium]|nr:hypothetical protein [Caldilineaceae bacterium]HRW06770.1 hypothetical protein [Caldilineaceae bacterium]
MMNVTVYDHASAAYISEMEYAASMHFSAAHLPSGTSSSLTAEEKSSRNNSSSERNPQYVQQRQVRYA